MLSIILQLLLITSIWSSDILMLSEYQFDNYVYSKKKLTISGNGLEVFTGTLCGQLCYGNSVMGKEISGIKSFNDDEVLAELSYKKSFSMFYVNPLVSIGGWDLQKLDRKYIALQIPLNLRIGDGQTSFFSTIGYRNGTIDDNPIATLIGVNKQTLSFDAGIGFNGWELHGSLEESQYSDVPRKMYSQLLNDTLFFQTFYDILNPFFNFLDVKTDPFPPNIITKKSIYFFGPLNSNFYLGGAVEFKNSKEQFYIPIAQNDDNKLTYASFPFLTPKNETLFKLILNFSKSWVNVPSIINKLTSKLSFPLFSNGTYRGYYVSPSGNIVEGFKYFDYHYNGLGELKLETNLEKRITEKVVIVSQFSWNSCPYEAYQFIGKNGYQYYSIKFGVNKEL